MVECCEAGIIRILKSTSPTYSLHGLIILNPGFNNLLNLPNSSTIPAKNIKKTIPFEVPNSYTQQHLQQQQANGKAKQMQIFPQHMEQSSTADVYYGALF